MDSTACVKGFLLASAQYRNDSNEGNVQQLLRQLDAISASKNICVYFSLAEVLPTECLNGLVQLVLDSQTNPAICAKAVGLLSQLAAKKEVLDTLRCTLDLTGALARLVHSLSTCDPHSILAQCLQLLQRLTYDVQLTYCSPQVADLLSYLVESVQAAESEHTMPCLRVLANFCRQSPCIQAQVKSFKNVKSLYRSLIHFLAHSSLTVVVFALSILTSLTLGEEVGERLFHAKNIHQTFQLIFNILVNGEGKLTRKYSVDLFMDLLENAKVIDLLSRYEHFSSCLRQILDLLRSKNGDAIEKILELLLAFSNVPLLRRPLCLELFLPGQNLQPGLRQSKRAGPSRLLAGVICWVDGLPHSSEEAAPLALELLREVCEEAVSSGMSLQPVHDSVLPVLGKHLRNYGMKQDMMEHDEEKVEKPKCDETRMARHCHVLSKCLDLLLVLCHDNETRALLASSCSSEVLNSLLDFQLAFNKMGLGDRSDNRKWSVFGADVIIKCLDFMSFTKEVLPETEAVFYKYLQDPRVVPFLTFALTSSDKRRVCSALRLLFEAAPLPDFPTVMLVDSVAIRNETHRHGGDKEVNERTQTMRLIPSASSLRCNVASPTPQPLPSKIQELAEQFHAGVQLNSIGTDPRTSDIIDVYEQKLSSLATKDNHLQDLLEAKASALVQADRMLSQYRYRCAQTEAEARRLAGLLREAERHCENLGAQLNEEHAEGERGRQDMERLLVHSRRLEAQMVRLTELEERLSKTVLALEEAEKQGQQLQAENRSLGNARNELMNQNEHLKQQNARTQELLREMEKQCQDLQKQLQAKEECMKDLLQTIMERDEQLTALEKERERSEETANAVRADLTRTEQARKELSIKASSLELQKSTRERELKQLEERLREVEEREREAREEIQKNAQMIAMIHSLSSGKLQPGTVNLSL
uniref:protein CIP2A n=1 Tax=Myxine glutinosa TaxID=7769 RepID=UPI00358EA674